MREDILPSRAAFGPNTLAMLGLGFGSGLPYLLIGSTLGFWLSEMAAPLGVIGACSWAIVPYSLKFLWARWLDARPAPLIGGHYGLRRGWILMAQAMVMLALLGVAAVGRRGDIPRMALFCCVAALAGATQDIAVDAFRIESGLAWSNEEAVLTAYQFGYRVALLMSDGVVFLLAERMGWPESYLVMALLMGFPLLAVHLAKEKAFAEGPVKRAMEDRTPAPRMSWAAWLPVFALIAAYRLPDLVINPMINPLYHDMGLGKDQVALIHMAAGIPLSFAGIAAAGAAMMALGLRRTLLLGAALQIIAVWAFAAVALSRGNLATAIFATAADNLSGSFTGIALVSYMSRFIAPGRAGLQFAALTSVYSLFGKSLSGLSGVCVDVIGWTNGRAEAYGLFFLLAGLMGIPTLILLAVKRPRNSDMAPEIRTG